MNEAFLKQIARVQDAGQRLNAMMATQEPGLRTWWQGLQGILENLRDGVDALELPPNAREKALIEGRDGALALAKRHMEQRHRVLREARRDWDTLQGVIARLTNEAAHMRKAIDEEVRCLGHLENELRGRIDGEAALKFFPVIQRAQKRLSEARDHQG